MCSSDLAYHRVLVALVFLVVLVGLPDLLNQPDQLNLVDLDRERVE